MIPLFLTGGASNAEFQSAASQDQTLNYNPIFQSGAGTISANPTDTTTQVPTISTSGLLSPSPAGMGLAGLGTVYPGSAAYLTSGLGSLTQSPLLMLLVLGAAAMLLMEGGGKKKGR